MHGSTLQENIKIHDKFQFEIKVGYELDEITPKTTYEIDTFFFIPSNLGINRESYSKSDFYNDMQVYIRFKTPSFVLDELAEENNPIHSHLKAAMISIVKDKTIEAAQEYEKQIKMFSCIFKASLRDHVEYIYSAKKIQDETIALRKFIDDAKAVITAFRRLRTIIAVPNLNEKVFSIFLYADEYLSILLEQFSFKIIKILEYRKPNNSDFVPMLKDLIKSEIQYRSQNGYPSIINQNGKNEVFLYRSSVFKKYMGSILFLHVKRQSEIKLLEHLIFSLAAGISMVVATGIAFYSQIYLGNLTFPFFVALVVSYMFKDRIKELFKQFFSEQIRKYFYDHKEKIFYTPSKIIGTCTESIDFCDSRKLPENIAKIRNCDHITEIENGWLGQSILHYKRSIELFSKSIRDTFSNYPIKSVNDILRFNLAKFMVKMDDPTKLLYCFSDDEVKSILTERDYHINLVMKFSIKNKKTFYKRFRIILTRDGISKLEEVPVVVI